MTSAARGAGQSRQATQILTFLIADVRGYTNFTQQHGDEAAARLAATFAEITREGVEARDGRVIELRGDEALAVFASARQAMRAAVDLQAVFADETERDPGVPLRVGIGIDAGEAVPVEDGYRGAALNFAARLCSQAAAFEVLATQGVVHLARAVEGVRVAEHGPLQLKGVDAPVTVLRVLPEHGDQLRPVVPRQSEAPAPLPPELHPDFEILAGRDPDLRWLRWNWRLARRGLGRSLLVTGPTGVGKTRLVAELAAEVHAAGGHVTYVSGAQAGDLRSGVGADDVMMPRLVVVEEGDRLSEQSVAALARAATELARQPVLLVVTAPDAGAVGWLARQLEEGGHRVLRPLEPADVRSLAASYLTGVEGEVPAAEIVRDTGGMPAAVLRELAAWASREGARRLGETVGRAAAGRSDLRAIEAELAVNVLDLQLTREQVQLAAGPAAHDPQHPPFKGLESFDIDDAGVFFGRERLVADMVARLAGSSLLGVVGPSGSGKSSAVRAGLLPALAEGILPDSNRWLRAVLRPSAYPLRELDRAIWAAIPERLREGISGEELPLRAVRDVLDPGERVLVVVDQFEEVFTACGDEDEREAFIRALTEAASDPAGRAVVVLAVRADFYGRCAAYPDLAEPMGSNHVLVGPMTKEEYRRAIERPARLAGVRFDPVLVDALVEEVFGEPGALPLLSTALLELWAHRAGKNIPFRAYAETGGVRGAVARLAESAYAELSGGQRDAGRAIMLRLAGPGEGDAVVRRRVPLTELDFVHPDVSAALDVFTRRRLVTVNDGSVEVAHEALLREWPRLHRWLQDDRTGHVLRQHVTDAARAWATGGRDPGELYRGSRLSSALDWTATHSLDLNELEREFLAQSQQASESEAERQRRTNRRLRGLLAGVAVFLVMSLVAGTLALVQRRNAREQANLAQREATAALAQRLGAQALVTKDLDLSLLLAREGVALHNAVDTRRNLHEALQRSPAALAVLRPLPGRLLNVFASADGQALAVHNNNSQVAFVDPRTRKVLGVQDGDLGFFGNTGHRAVVVRDGSIVIVDAVRNEVVAEHPMPDHSGFSVSPDLSTLALAQVGRMRFVELATGRARDVPAPRGVRFDDVLYAASGRHLVVTTLKEPDAPDPFARPYVLSWWDIEPFRSRRSVTLEGATWSISPDGRRLAIGNADGSLETVDLRSGKRRSLKGRHGDAIVGSSWSPDGQFVASGSEDRQAMVWDVRVGDVVETLRGHNGRVFAPAISPDGRTAYTVSLDGSMIVWDLAGDRRLARLFPTGRGNPIRYPADHLAVTPDGQRFAVGRIDGVVEVRDVRSLRLLHSLQAGEGPVLGVAFSPDSRQLATSASPASVTTWSMADGSRQSRMEFLEEQLPPEGNINDVERLAYSPDGTVLAGGDDKARILWWDPRTGAQVGEPLQVPRDPLLPPEANQGVLGLTFSPDGSIIAATGGSEAVWWRRADRKQIAKVDVDDDYGLANALAFTPDGRTLATGGGNGTVRFWNTRTGESTHRSFLAIAGWVHSLQFTADGRRILVSGGDGTARIFPVGSSDPVWSVSPRENALAAAALTPDAKTALVVYQEGGNGYAWNLDPRAWMEHACSVAGRQPTRQEWQQFLPERPYRPACRRT